MIGIGGPNAGYPDDDTAPLGWMLKMTLRHALLTRPIVIRGRSYEPEVDPLVVDDGSEYIEIAQNPNVLGWGLPVHDELPTTIRSAAVHEFGTIWLGCIH